MISYRIDRKIANGRGLPARNRVADDLTKRRVVDFGRLAAAL